MTKGAYKLDSIEYEKYWDQLKLKNKNKLTYRSADVVHYKPLDTWAISKLDFLTGERIYYKTLTWPEAIMQLLTEPDVPADRWTRVEVYDPQTSKTGRLLSARYTTAEVRRIILANWKAEMKTIYYIYTCENCPEHGVALHIADREISKELCLHYIMWANVHAASVEQAKDIVMPRIGLFRPTLHKTLLDVLTQT